MIRGRSINLAHMFDVPEKFKVMTLIVETIKRTGADQKRSCGYAPTFRCSSTPRWEQGHIFLIKSIFPRGQNLRTMRLSWMHHIQHVLKPRRRERERAKDAKAAKAASAPDASQVMLKTKQDQLSYLLEATVRIEKGLPTPTQNQESLERIIETKFHDLDVKVTEIQTTVEKL